MPARKEFQVRKISSTIAAAVLGGGLLLAAAVPANAEVLAAGTSGKATIVPVGAPAGAKVSKATVTVKKGSKTVARNKKTYKAKKGTYKVTSKITYRPVTTTTIPADKIMAKCRVSSREITSDRTQWEEWFDGTGYYAGQVTVRYTGSCTDSVFVGSKLTSMTWTTVWTEDDYIMTTEAAPSANWAALKLAEVSYKVGDIDYVFGKDMTTLPTISKLGGTKTTSNTRSVTVR